jgi:hypothetical protein
MIFSYKDRHCITTKVKISKLPAWLGWQLLGLTLGGVFWLWSMALKN